MNRRQFIQRFLLGTGVLAAAGGGLWLSSQQVSRAQLSMELALAKLDSLQPQQLSATGDWNLFQIFSHCAQSIEYSLSGFPEHKSPVFKHTLGKAAFAVFSARGEMAHSLSEPIPGAPTIAAQGEVNSAIRRFRQAMLAFQAHQGPLAPHFAYGELSKADYEVAHVMHFYNHLEEVQGVG
ncbi:DUF1569 domain-containing protein [Bowmanella denitrificans]|uniref:DUF1569 domain-containing protein n=1 Tax=Bowmanella denitrificans TaxID=366582 RepID=UPI000C9CF474|nr:DUF1569 domain-containing protein [Bowmanella denitrificans]